MATRSWFEKLGRQDRYRCNSGWRFQELLPAVGEVRWQQPRLLPPRIDDLADLQVSRESGAAVPEGIEG